MWYIVRVVRLESRRGTTAACSLLGNQSSLKTQNTNRTRCSAHNGPPLSDSPLPRSGQSLSACHKLSLGDLPESPDPRPAGLRAPRRKRPSSIACSGGSCLSLPLAPIGQTPYGARRRYMYAALGIAVAGPWIAMVGPRSSCKRTWHIESACPREAYG